MDRVISDTRGNDLGSIRKDSMDYIVKYDQDPTGGKSVANKDKSNRGFYNLSTARMLCPYRKLNKFDEDPVA